MSVEPNARRLRAHAEGMREMATAESEAGHSRRLHYLLVKAYQQAAVVLDDAATIVENESARAEVPQ